MYYIPYIFLRLKDIFSFTYKNDIQTIILMEEGQLCKNKYIDVNK